MNCAVLTDSTSDISPELAAKLDIYVIPLRVEFDGREWLDTVELRSSELFERISAGAALPTSHPPVEIAYRVKLTELLQSYDHVIALHITSKMSDTVLEAQKIAAEFPGRVTVIDSQVTSAALALNALRVKRLLQNNIPPEQIRTLLELLLPSMQNRLCVNNLTYLQKNGRIGGATSLIGGVVSIKPVLELRSGQVEPFDRALGAQRALKLMIQQLEEYAQTTPDAQVAFFHNGNPDAVSKLREVAHRLNMTNPFNLELGAVISAHTGPQTYGYSAEPKVIWHEHRPY